MNVEARSQTIKSVLKKGKFFIPDYQREFDWDEEELTEFLEDLEEVPENESYFIGHMVFEGEFNSTKFSIIDGQQRFTVITIALCAVRDRFFELSEENYAKGIHENYIFSKDENYEEYVVLVNQMPYPLLQKRIQSLPGEKENVEPSKSGERKILNTYSKIQEYLLDYDIDQLKNFRDKLLNLEIIFVSVSDEVDAFTIFETLNAKGRDLTPLDLIKNQIFRLYPRKDHLDEPNDSWKQILLNTGESKIKFLNNFWSSRYKKVSDRKIYKEFHNQIVKSKDRENEIVKFVQQMQSDSIIFKKVKNPLTTDWKENGTYRIYLSLEALQIFNIEVANSFLISLLREYFDKKISLDYCKKVLHVMERFHFINNAVGAQKSSGLDTMYAKMAKDLHIAPSKSNKHIILDQTIGKLKDKMPKKEVFEAEFDNRLYYCSDMTKQKKLVTYALRKIENFSQKYNVELKNMSIEHIYPEKPNGKWTELQSQDLVMNLGNLVLLDSGLNSKIGNTTYDAKKDIILKESTLLTTKKVFEQHKEWNENSIVKRRNQLLDLLYEGVWKA